MIKGRKVKNRKVISLIFVFIMLNIPISALECKAVTYSGNIILAFGVYLYVNEEMPLESEIEWRFAIRGGGLIFVFASDKENFDLFKSGDSNYSMNVLSASYLWMASGIFRVPKSENWHIIFLCWASYGNLTYEVTFHKPNLGLILGIPGGIVGLGLIIGAILLAKKKKRI